MVKIPNKDGKEAPKQKQQPIQMRENPFARRNKAWWQFWKKEQEYGKRIELNARQVTEAYALLQENKPIVLNIKEENYKTIPEPEAIEPVLFLMKENGYIDVLENVKTGEFIISTPKGEKSIWLTPDKLQSIKIGEQYFRGWVAYENCMTPYPEDPIYSAELQRKIIQKVAINYQNLNEAAILTARTKMWLYIIGAITIALVLIFSTDFGQNLFHSIMNGGGKAAASAAQTIAQNVTNAAQAAANTGVTVQ